MSPKSDRINKLYAELLNFKKSPLYQYRQQNNFKPVIGDGNPASQILFIGEAPGKNEALTGKPFCGASGKVLDHCFTAQAPHGPITITPFHHPAAALYNGSMRPTLKQDFMILQKFSKL